MMTKSQGEALCALLGQLRKDWDLPGIRAAITKAAELGNAADVAVAACRIAGNRDAHTPGLIPMQGTHWQGTTVATRQVPTLCLIHPTEPLGRCSRCDAAALNVDHERLAADARAVLTVHGRTAALRALKESKP